MPPMLTRAARSSDMSRSRVGGLLEPTSNPRPLHPRAAHRAVSRSPDRSPGWIRSARRQCLRFPGNTSPGNLGSHSKKNSKWEQSGKSHFGSHLATLAFGSPPSWWRGRYMCGGGARGRRRAASRRRTAQRCGAGGASPNSHGGTSRPRLDRPCTPVGDRGGAPIRITVLGVAWPRVASGYVIYEPLVNTHKREVSWLN